MVKKCPGSKIRSGGKGKGLGTEATTAYVNGNAGGVRVYGGVAATTLTIMEYTV